tara:strand:+ start:529 stop:954 length:426 start_codon:yes stop_codon:yes gene_type:complete
VAAVVVVPLMVAEAVVTQVEEDYLYPDLVAAVVRNLPVVLVLTHLLLNQQVVLHCKVAMVVVAAVVDIMVVVLVVMMEQSLLVEVVDLDMLVVIQTHLPPTLPTQLDQLVEMLQILLIHIMVDRVMVAKVLDLRVELPVEL